MTYTRNEPILTAKNVCVTYDRPILKDVSFQVSNIVRPGVEQGQVVSIIGRSGIGKSQLFRCLAGLQKPTSGEVLIGQDQHAVHAGEVGVVPQNYVLLRHRTILSNLRLAHRAYYEATGHPFLVGMLGFDAMIHEFRLDEHLKKYPHQISGGQRQRVSILQQILAGNKTILLDEPFSGLDVAMIEKVLALLQKVSLMDELNTLVIVSHDIESALAISDTAFILGVPEGQEGASVVHTVDLAERDLAFREGVRDLPAFRETVKEVRSKI